MENTPRFAVLIENDPGADLHEIAELVSGYLELSPLEARMEIRRTKGLIARDRFFEETDALAEGLTKAGFPARAVPMAGFSLNQERPIRLRSGYFENDRFLYNDWRTESCEEISFHDVILLSAGLCHRDFRNAIRMPDNVTDRLSALVGITDPVLRVKTRRALLESATTVADNELSAADMSGEMKVEERAVKGLLEIYLERKPFHLRIEHDAFNYHGLGNRIERTAVKNFLALVQRFVCWLPLDRLAERTVDLAEEGLQLHLLFADIHDLERYNEREMCLIRFKGKSARPESWVPKFTEVGDRIELDQSGERGGLSSETTDGVCCLCGKPADGSSKFCRLCTGESNPEVTPVRWTPVLIALFLLLGVIVVFRGVYNHQIGSVAIQHVKQQVGERISEYHRKRGRLSTPGTWSAKRKEGTIWRVDYTFELTGTLSNEKRKQEASWWVDIEKGTFQGIQPRAKRWMLGAAAGVDPFQKNVPPDGREGDNGADGIGTVTDDTMHTGKDSAK